MKYIIILINITILFTLCSANSTDVNIPFDRHFHTEPILPFNTWGSFRGLHYFGLKTSSPDSPAIGLLWFSNTAKDVDSIHTRHWCEINDNLIYGWKSHNFHDFGFQTIIDNNYSFNTSFVKDSEHYWRAQVSVQRSKGTENKSESISLIVYSVIQRETDLLKVLNFNSTNIKIYGFNEFIGNYSLNIGTEAENIIYSGYLESQTSIVDIIKTIKNNLIPLKVNGTQIFGLKSGETPIKTTFIAFQAASQIRTKINIEFKSEDQSEPIDQNENYEKELSKRIKLFDQQFEQKFGLRSKGFNESYVEFGKSVLSEMLGDIGYFNGDILVESPGMKKPVSYGPLQILSGLSSRPPLLSSLPMG